MMSVLEQYKYDGSKKPDFRTLPTLISPDEEMMRVEPKSLTTEGLHGTETAETKDEELSGTPEETAAVQGAEFQESDAVKLSENKVNNKEGENPVREFLKEKASANLTEIGKLQKAMHAARKRGLIVICHGMPYSGRTEMCRYLRKGMRGGVKIRSYKKGDHLHDFLWQMHKNVPKYGNICLMKGSVYDDIAGTEGGAERVAAFEKYLKDSGISVVRIFLNVSAKRQKKRMIEVITTKPGGAPRQVPQDKGWRKEFLDRFAELIAAATDETPWYIIPADSKWYARCLVTEIVRDALRECVRAEQPAENDSASEPAPIEVQDDTVAEQVSEEIPAVEEPAAEPAEKVPAVEEPAVEPAEEVPAVEEPAVEPVEEVPAVEESAVEPVEEMPVTKEPDSVPASADEQAVSEPAAEKKPVRRTRRKKAETPDAEVQPAEKKPAARRTRRQGAPKTVEETLARRRKRMDSEG